MFLKKFFNDFVLFKNILDLFKIFAILFWLLIISGISFWDSVQPSPDLIQQHEVGPVQSRSFRVLQKITDTDECNDVGTEQIRKMELSEDEKLLMNKFKEQGRIILFINFPFWCFVTIGYIYNVHRSKCQIRL